MVSLRAVECYHNGRAVTGRRRGPAIRLDSCPMCPSPVDKLSPADRPADAFGLGETFVLVLVAFLSGVLLPAWADSGTEYVPDFLGQMVNPWILPALGLLWVVRCGSVDFSVWVVFALGWAVSGAIVAAGGHAALALAAVAALGLAAGGINAAAVVVARLPGWGATGITALVGLSAASALVGRVSPAADAAVLRRWAGVHGPIWLAGSVYILALLVVLLGATRSRRGDLSHPSAMAAALLGSGLLSALGGLCGLARWGQMPLHVHLVGDLRLVAAVVLSGAVVLRGPRRGLLAAILLPPSMLLATVWRQRVWDLPSSTVAVNVLMLAGMALGAQWAMMPARPGRLRPRRWPAAAALLGIVAVALTAGELSNTTARALRLLGAGLWLAGMAAAVVGRLSDRQARTGRSTGA